MQRKKESSNTTQENIPPKLKVLPIIEIYPCIQTEGSKAGIPHFMVRTTGCTHRCFFGKGGFCDTWYTSINPEKGKYTLIDIQEMFTAFPNINHLMISGGSPTMHRDVVNDVINIAQIVRKMHVTLETEGSHYIETDYRIDLLSISPKFANSIPRLEEGELSLIGPNGDILDREKVEKLAIQHNKFRLNHDAIAKMIEYHKDYHFKPVVDREDSSIWSEIEAFIEKHQILNDHVWVMPAGDTRKSIVPNYSYVINECVRRGYNFTGRAHIIAFDTERGV